MSRKKKLLSILGTLIGLAVICSGFAVYKLAPQWNNPLGPSLGLEETQQGATTPIFDTNTPDFSTPVLDADSTTAIGALGAADASQTAASAEVVTPPSPVKRTATPAPLCGGPSVMVVMAVGIDYRPDGYLYGLADVIKIVRIDYVTPRVTVLSIPRDLWVHVPGISDHYGITQTKLNDAYFFGTEGMGYYDGPGGGAGLLARTLGLNFGIRPDHYGVINMATFTDVVNSVGGIDVYLDHSVDGNVGPNAEDHMGFYPAGWNHLSGLGAVEFSRIRKVDNIFNRMDRQTQVLCALKDKVLSAKGVISLPQIINAFTDRVLTDLSPAEISQMACLLPLLGDGGIQFTSFPQELFTASATYDPYAKHETFTWDVDFNILREYVEKFLAGEWPAPSNGSDGNLTCPVYPEKP